MQTDKEQKKLESEELALKTFIDFVYYEGINKLSKQAMKNKDAYYAEQELRSVNDFKITALSNEEATVIIVHYREVNVRFYVENDWVTLRDYSCSAANLVFLINELVLAHNDCL